jgi:hypothetical protein
VHLLTVIVSLLSSLNLLSLFNYHTKFDNLQTRCFVSAVEVRTCCVGRGRCVSDPFDQDEPRGEIVRAFNSEHFSMHLLRICKQMAVDLPGVGYDGPIPRPE